MTTFFVILIFSVIAIALCFLGMGVKILLKKNGQFKHTCAFDWEEKRCKDCSGNCSQCTKDSNKIPKIKVE